MLPAFLAMLYLEGRQQYDWIPNRLTLCDFFTVGKFSEALFAAKSGEKPAPVNGERTSPIAGNTPVP